MDRIESRRSLLRDERGFSLTELLVGLSLSLAIGASGLALLGASRPSATKELERQNIVNEGRGGLDRMVRELRQADSVNATSPALLDVNVPTASGERRIVYQCDLASAITGLRACQRFSGAVGGALGAGSVVIDGLSNGVGGAPVFGYAPDSVRPLRVDVTLALPARGQQTTGYSHSITLRDGFFLRNLDLAGN